MRKLKKTKVGGLGGCAPQNFAAFHGVLPKAKLQDQKPKVFGQPPKKMRGGKVLHAGGSMTRQN
jgi:hypothetical protein